MDVARGEKQTWFSGLNCTWNAAFDVVLRFDITNLDPSAPRPAL